jgi:hypothetical protein
MDKIPSSKNFDEAVSLARAAIVCLETFERSQRGLI